MKRHIKYTCHCGKKFKTESRFKKHQATKHLLIPPVGLESGKTCINELTKLKEPIFYNKVIHCTFCPNCGTKLPTL